MEIAKKSRWRTRGWFLACMLMFTAHEASAAGRSALSRWLADVATPQIREQLAQHPRYAGQAVQLTRVQHNGLAEALVTVLTMNLQGREGIVLYTPASTPPRPAGLPARIDDLDCGSAEERRTLLLVSVTGTEGRAGRVMLSLVEPGADGQAARSWQWQGSLTAAERKTLQRSPAVAAADGSLEAPWRDPDVESAATGLHLQMVCALRPQVKTRLGLEWVDAAKMPPMFADVVNHSRHLLGNYVELGFTADEPDYRVQAELTPFREDVWQLWLTGTPQKAELAPVQAVTYFRSEQGGVAPAKTLVDAGSLPLTSPAPDRGPALDYLDVEMVDAWQTDSSPRNAELQVQLRLRNRSDWPIDYAFRLSGGHYQHCLPNPAYYRHDRYGRLEGRLDPGESLLERLVIEGVKHRPNPWMGLRKCAGFRSLEGFEEFESKGYAVTDYVRWGL